MTFAELLEATKGMKIGSDISLGSPSRWVGSVSCYRDGDEWVLTEIDERQRVYERRGTEEDIVRKMYGIIKIRQWS